MTIRTCLAKIIPARWCRVRHRRSARHAGGALLLASACFAAAPGPLATLVHPYRSDPTPAHLAAVQSYAAAHPAEGPLANLALGVVAYEQEDYAAAIAVLAPTRAHLPQIADYAGYYLAAARVESDDFATVASDLAPAHNSSPWNGKAWILEARARQSTDAPGCARLLLDHYPELPQPDGDLTLGDCYQAAKDAPHAAEAYQRVYAQYVTGDAAARATAALAALGQGMGTPAQLLHHADRLAEVKDYLRAKREYQSLAATLTGLERDQARVRAGAMDYQRKQESVAWPYLSGLDLSATEADAERFYYLVECARRRDDDGAIASTLQKLAQQYPRSPWRLKALASAANRYLLLNRPADYVPLNRTIYQDFPNAPQAGTAHWKVAFQAYLTDAPDASSLMSEHLRNYFGHPTLGASLYFLGRNFERAGDKGAARACYQRLSGAFENHYYAMLARDGVKQPEIAGAPLPPAPAEIALFLTALRLGGASPVPTDPTPSTTLRIERSRLLRAAGLADLADGELPLGAGNTGQHALLAIEMASNAPAPSRGLQMMKALNTEYLNLPVPGAPRQFWELLFPLPYKSDLVSSAESQNLDPFLVAGLIRQESEFNPQALSPAKAYGLTQVRPATGRLFARKAGVAAFTTSKLYQPAANLKIGTSIFRSMLDQQNGSLEQTLAAYNAGPNRVANWITWATFREPAEFVETIPFTETRDYVQAVLRNAEMYRRLYK